MGWRAGQGVGPRAKRKLIGEEEEDIHAKDFLFAPVNTQMMAIQGKRDAFGLGYDPLKSAPEFSNKKQKIEKMAEKRSGFGVGIFEEEDEDVYDISATKYEMTIDDDEDRFILGKSSKADSQKTEAPSKLYPRQAPNQKRLCRDGRPPLFGFDLSLETLAEPQWCVLYNDINNTGFLRQRSPRIFNLFMFSKTQLCVRRHPVMPVN